MSATNSGSSDVTTQMIERKINGMPHYEYKSTQGDRKTMPVEGMVKDIDVDKNWVVERISVAVDSLLTCADVNTFQEIMFLSLRHEEKDLVEDPQIDGHAAKQAVVFVQTYVPPTRPSGKETLR